MTRRHRAAVTRTDTDRERRAHGQLLRAIPDVTHPTTVARMHRQIRAALTNHEGA